MRAKLGLIVRTMKLGIICESTVNSYYRALFPARALARRGHTVVWPENNVDVPLASLLTCDLVHCYRRMDRLDDLRKLGRYGVAISFDNDDNYAVAEVSNGGKGVEGRRYNRQLARMTVAAAKLADVTTTTRVPLAEYYRAEGVEHVTVIGNHLEPDVFAAPARAKHDGVVLGWVAEREHVVDRERLPIVPALSELLASCPELRVVSVGLRLPIGSERYEHIESAPFLELLKTVGTFDIGIAPLADTEFNRSRSDVKLKEYSTAGAAWLASPVGPYQDLGEAEGGLLVPDDQWVEKARELIDNARKRRRLTKRALRWAKEQAIDRKAHLWESAFAEAIGRAAGELAPARVSA